MNRKQGPPEPLSEEHFARLKRKAGLPVDDPPAQPTHAKKRKTTKAPKKTEQVKRNGRSKPKPKEPSPEESSDEDMGDEFDLADLALEEGDDLLGPKGGKGQIWSDDGSDGESGFDSEEETTGKKEKFVWSDDEDESDAEEKLTAANIEGLSHKLDKQLADEKAAAEAELQESALQINVDGPKVLGDGDEDDEVANKSQLAPDLQLLRQRLSDTIRILDDFAKLGEAGHSRAEYTAQLLKDICDVRIFSRLPFCPAQP